MLIVNYTSNPPFDGIHPHPKPQAEVELTYGTPQCGGGGQGENA